MASCSMETWNFFPWDLAVFVRLLLKATPRRMVSSLCLSRLIWSSNRPQRCTRKEQQQGRVQGRTAEKTAAEHGMAPQEEPGVTSLSEDASGLQLCWASRGQREP